MSILQIVLLAITTQLVVSLYMMARLQRKYEAKLQLALYFSSDELKKYKGDRA